MLKNGKFVNLVEAVVYIALNAKPDAVRGTAICKAQGLPERYLEADLQNLVHNGVLKSVRGPKGGYVLAKERRNITLADIYNSLHHEIKSRKESTSSVKAIIIPLVDDVEKKLLENLSGISLEEIALKAPERPTGLQKSEFTI